jgi:hypothetical protein
MHLFCAGPVRGGGIDRTARQAGCFWLDREGTNGQAALSGGCFRITAAGRWLNSTQNANYTTVDRDR